MGRCHRSALTKSGLCKQLSTTVSSAAPDDAGALEGKGYIDQQDGCASQRYRGDDVQDVINALHGFSLSFTC